MIVLDTSAIIALLADEPEARAMEAVLASHYERRISAATVVEATMVAARWGEEAATDGLDALIKSMTAEIAAFDAEQARAAQVAFLRFGKGRGHPAQLNFGDCISYALAKTLNAPLLFKGDDFLKTDIRAALI